MLTGDQVRFPSALVLTAGVLILSMTSCRKQDALGPDRTLPVESRFNSTAEGWSVAGDGVMSHASQGGNPGGYIQTVDQVNGPTQYFVAPAVFLGNRVEAYGRLLTFELKWTGVDEAEVADQVQVILRGSGLTLAAHVASGPGPAWTAYAIRLDASGGWTHDATGLVASTAEIQLVLTSLQQLWIRAEYNEGVETTGLDNVVFGIEG